MANTCKFFEEEIHGALLYLTYSLCVYFISSQTTSEDVFSEDEWLSFSFLGLKEAR